MQSRIAIVVAVVLTGAISLRAFGLRSRSLWFDEAFTWQLVQFPFAEMFVRATQDNSPPFYYIALYAWCALFGNSALAMRSLSVICGTAAIVGTYALAQELNQFAEDNAPRPAGSTSAMRGPNAEAVQSMNGSPVLGAALLASSPFQITMSAEARPYALGVLLAVVSTWAFVRIMRHAATWPTLVVYWAATTLFVYTHHFAWFIVAGQAVFAISSELFTQRCSPWNLLRSIPLQQLVASFFCAIAAYSPWLPILLRQTTQVHESFWIPSPTALDISTLVYRMFALPTIGVEVDPVDALTAGMLFLMAVACFVWRATTADALLISLIIAGAGLPLVLSWAVVSLMNPRYFIFVHVFMLLAISSLIARTSSLFSRRLLGAMAIGASILAYFAYCRQVELGNAEDGFIGVAAYLDNKRLGRDPVVVCRPYAFFPVLAHAQRKDDIRLYVKDHLLHFYGIAALTEDLLCSDRALEYRPGKTRRLWLVERDDAVFRMPDRWKRNLRATFGDDFMPERMLYVTECIADP